MKKLHLTLDELHVESFDVSAGDNPLRGTVRGHVSNPYDCPTIPLYCLSDNYSECRSCQGTCNNSCNGTCVGPTCDASCANGTCPPECWD